MKKKTKILAIAASCLAMGVGAIGLAAYNGGGVFQAAAAVHDSSHTLTEKAFETPKVGSVGYRPYWHCAECCKTSADDARYSFEDKSTKVTEEDVTIPALTGATVEEIAEGDEIANVKKTKFKYVDQGANGVDGKEGNSTPLFVKDSGKTAIYFSRSGKTGESDGKCAEFRFTTAAKMVKSVTFSYRLCNWGTGTSEESGVAYTNYCQFIYPSKTEEGKDAYDGLILNDKLVNDDAWHTLTVNYSDFNLGIDVKTDFTGFLLKFADLRGYVMVSDLSYEEVFSVTLKNAASDGTDVTEIVGAGALPTTPTMSGKKFLGWYDESGNKVESVTASTGTLVAKWGAVVAKSELTTEETALTIDPQTITVSPAVSVSRLDSDDGIFMYLQTAGVSTFDITLPAFDYNSAGRVDFFFNNNYAHLGHGKISVGSGCFEYSSTHAYTAEAYIVSDGTNASLYINSTFIATLDEDTSCGNKGLNFTFERDASADTYMQLNIGDFKQNVFDYMDVLDDATSAFPDTITDDNKADAISAYKNYASVYPTVSSLMTAYEKANYSEPSNVASAKTSLAGETTEVVSVPSSGDGWNTAHSLGIYSDANFGISYATRKEINWVSIDFQVGGYSETKTFYVDLPKVNYSAYSSVTFKIYSPGSNISTTSIKADGKDWISNADCPNEDWPRTITISTIGGITKIVSDNGGTVELSEAVATGTKALRLERTRLITDASTQLGYDGFVFSSLVATI